MIDVVIQLVLAVVLMYLVGEATKVEGKEGFTFSIYPWITTLPETMTTALLAISGYYTAALYNSVFSAVFDIAVGLGLVAIVYGVVEFRLTDLAALAAVSAFAFVVADIDGVIDLNDGLLLYAFLVFSIVYSVAKYGMFRKRLSAIDTLKIAAGLLALAAIGVWYYRNVEALCNIVGEKLGGIVSAVLTSLPDVIVAVVYGLSEPEAQAEVLGAVAHDFIENVPTAAIVAGLLANRCIVDSNPVITIAAAATTAAALLFVSSYRRVTRFEGYVLLLLFGICCYIALI